MKYLGSTFDIHCGGIDHIPVHHTNEIAQSEAATGKLFARFWLHGEFLVDGEKRMGKSEGNAMTLAWLKEQQLTPLSYRYFCLGTHYRKVLNFSLEAVGGAARALETLQNKVATLGEPNGACSDYEAKFFAAVNDDLNMPQALAVVWELLKSDQAEAAKKASLLKFDEVLGLGLKNVKPLVVPKDVQAMVTEREQAREAKNWTHADTLRQTIAERGFAVDDTELGPITKPLSKT
jgi:cysteinyl-tRNA synthetase